MHSFYLLPLMHHLTINPWANPKYQKSDYHTVQGVKSFAGETFQTMRKTLK